MVASGSTNGSLDRLKGGEVTGQLDAELARTWKVAVEDEHLAAEVAVEIGVGDDGAARVDAAAPAQDDVDVGREVVALDHHHQPGRAVRR
jgi:hypothetical protein